MNIQKKNNNIISIILPTYNEVDNIELIIAKIAEVLDVNNMNGEIIVVDDNSPDGTANIARGLSEKYPVKVRVRKTARGLSRSVLKGFEVAQGSICLVMDADLSHPVERIPDMVEPIIGGEYDMSVGSRYISGGGWDSGNSIRNKVSRFASFLSRGLTSLSDLTSGYMAIRKGILKTSDIDPLGWKIVLEIAVKVQPRIKEVPILFSKRNAGKSKLGLRAQYEYLYHLMKLYYFKHLGRR